MSEIDYDLIIVGAGPAGLSLAEKLQNQGLRIAVLEARQDVAAPSHTVLVPNTFLAEIGLEDTLERVPCIGNTHHSLHVSHDFEDPDASHSFVETGAILGCLSQRIGDPTILPSHRVTDVRTSPEHLEVQVEARGTRMSFRCRFLAACAGADSPLSPPTAPGPTFVRALEHVVEDVRARPGYFESFHTHRYSPGLYAWIFNLGPTRAVVGLGTTSHSPRQLLSSFIAEHPVARDHRLHEGRIIHSYGGLMANGQGQLVHGRTIFVGDAAGGLAWLGGITYPGARLSADLASGPILAAIEKDDPEVLQDYVTNWHRAIGGRLEKEAVARAAYESLSDAELDEAFTAYQSGSLRQAVVAFARDRGLPA